MKIFILLFICLAGCTEIANVSGENQSTAKKEAEQWAKDHGMENAVVTCVKSQTTNSGYLSCDVSLKKSDGSFQFVKLACAAKFNFNDGCKIVPAINQ